MDVDDEVIEHKESPYDNYEASAVPRPKWESKNLKIQLSDNSNIQESG